MTAVSHHASLRWLQRVNPREPRPAECVLDAFRRADRVERDDGFRPAEAAEVAA